ncbi:glycoside/pentoside/hexuronide:cation symporter, GPH family [Verrucomicrobium sp. GAS474]|uniref:MFS transporter n=1 Tax=Verrucomicrobium sp. GAS474 TaxID=1882831 RepID=UPI00087CC193|nr:MFS transporter [Verrucomicrobium sp. GAS474]SDT94824.1 glycoside/pentoside/hexuronide:cation symporter, GPH family [Verrucomicrobium sp. GAS474]
MHLTPSQSPGKIPEKDRVPFWQKVAYGLGGPVEGTAIWIPQGNLTPVFNIALGLNPALLGIVLMCWRIWDAAADQVMGNFSDNARTRWGRRKPFIVLGAILTALTMPVIWWMPHGLPEWQMFAWLLLGGILFYSCFSIWAMPYYSLQLEMSPDYNERTNITAYRAYAQQFLQLAGGWILALASLPIFSRLPGGAPDLANGMRYISLGLAALTLVLGVLPGLFVRERYYAKEASRQPKEPLWQGLKQTLSTRPFLWIITIVFTKTFGFGLIGTLGFYLNAYYACGGDLHLATKIGGVIATALFAPNLLAIPLCTWIANRWDKKTLLYITVLSGLCGSLSVSVFVTPAHPWLQVIPPLLMGPVGIGLWLVVPSMQADVADYDEWMGGKRREGSFSAVFSWTLKATTALSGGLSGVLLVLCGFKSGPHAAQDPHVLATLKLFYIGTPLLFLIVSLFAISRYPLTREKVAEIRAALEARRGVI